VAPIQRQRRRGPHTVHKVRLQFNSYAKASSDRALLRTASGKPFQTRGAVAAKERSPKDVFILTTFSIWRPALRVPERRLPAQQQSVIRYSGLRSFRHLCTSIAILYCMRCRTGSQWRTFSTGVMWSERRVPVTRRAAAFWTDCNRFRYWSATPNNSELQ